LPAQIHSPIVPSRGGGGTTTVRLLIVRAFSVSPGSSPADWFHRRNRRAAD
jgi:hypothetical protein